ncbi:chitin recognition protein, partial [Diplocarpon rosae]
MMFSTSFIAAAAASLSITPFVSALYDAKAHDNVAVYYGQGHNQPRLKQFCQSSDIDVIPIGFINSFPAQANGLVGVNFGNQCWGGFSTYPGPGYNGALQPENDKLFIRCPALQEDIHFCQTVMNKTILLSVGGAIGDYDLSSENEGEDLADFLWKAYGPYDQEYVDRGGIRPLDRGYFNVDSTKRIDIDGFDFDIQRPASGGQAAYIAAINRLRYHYNLYKYFYPTSKTYLISGSPQCPLHDNQMDEIITEAKFDLLFIQYYNNGLSRSTARNFLDGTGRFNFNQWADFVNTGRSKGAKLYVGLLGSPEAGTAGDYVTPAEVKPLILTYRSHPQFGGVMIWDATHAKSKVLFDSREMSYYQAMKTILRIPPPRVIPTRVGHRTTRASSSSDQTYTPSQQATSNSVPSHPNLTSAVSSYKPSSSSSVHVSGTVSSSSGYPAPTEGTAYSNHSSSSSSRTASVQGYPYESSTAVSSTRSVVSGYVTPSSPPTYSAGVRVNSSAIYATGSSHAASGSVHSSSPPTYSAGVRVNSSAIYATGSSYAASGPVHTRILPVHPTGKYANSSSVQNPPVPTGGYGIAPIGTPTPECSMSCGIGNDSSKCCKSNDPSSECPGGVCPYGSSESNSPSKCPGG